MTKEEKERNVEETRRKKLIAKAQAAAKATPAKIEGDRVQHEAAMRKGEARAREDEAEPVEVEGEAEAEKFPPFRTAPPEPDRHKWYQSS